MASSKLASTQHFICSVETDCTEFQAEWRQLLAISQSRICQNKNVEVKYKSRNSPINQKCTKTKKFMSKSIDTSQYQNMKNKNKDSSILDIDIVKKYDTFMSMDNDLVAHNIKESNLHQKNCDVIKRKFCFESKGFLYDECAEDPKRVCKKCDSLKLIVTCAKI